MNIPSLVHALTDGVVEFVKVCQEVSISVDAYGWRVWTLDLPALIRAKTSAGREKDVQALSELLSLLDARMPE